MLSFRLANPDPDSWPDDFVLHRANEAFVGDFGWTEATTVVAITGAAGAGDEILGLAAAIDGDPGFLGTTVDWRDDVVFLDTHDAFPTGSDESKASIDRLRTELIPNALGATDARANVGGTEAYSIDETRLMMAGSPWAVAFILGASFLLLLVAFRSIVIPLKAIALNLVGTLATFGVLVAVYQWGWGERLLGLPHVEGISPYMPVMVFALVFGLSMDYHVFLLSRIKERYDATGDNTRAVADGLTRTGPLITGAAIIMVAVFGGFAAASVPEISQWGFGLAAGVLIDATIIRALLVPAAMVWLGTANWYLPAWLGWLPRWNFEAPSAVASRKEDEREPALA
jgi:RND superfamily putative drug exporter